MSIILGIDPGSRITGFGVIETVGNKQRYIASGNIRVAKGNFSDQLRQIFTGISEIVEQHQPEETAIEQVFVSVNANSALKLGQARGAAIVAVARKCAKVVEYSARQVKQAIVGYGNAEKSQVQYMVKLLLKIQDKLQEDEADALAIAICHANSRRGLII
jgi:crossover junction endodeoxyribonuclease RuvC